MKKRIFALFLALVLCAAAVFSPAALAAPNDTASDPAALYSGEDSAYYYYAAANADAQPAQSVFPADIGEGGVLSPEMGTLTLEITVDRTALYELLITYQPLTGNMAAIERELLINGSRPFKELTGVTFERVFEDADEIKQDKTGNDIVPDQREVEVKREKRICDTAGYYSEPYRFLLNEGVNTISFVGVQGDMQIFSLSACPSETVASYEEIKKSYSEKGYKDAEGSLPMVPAEAADYKSNHTLVPSYDRSSPATVPYDTTKLRLNTMGGDKWNASGMWMEWIVEVEKSGLYAIDFKYRQNSAKGSTVFRKLTIDGQLPFAEAAALSFPYDRSWNFSGSADNSYLYYLSEGTHTIRLEATLGEMGDILRQSEEFLQSLNALYRAVITVTGTSPDIYRDYKITQRIPGLKERFKELENQARSLISQIEAISGGRNSISVMFESFADQLKKLGKKPEKITSILSDFKNNIISLSSILSQIRSCPLELDYIMITAPGTEMGSANGGFFAKLKHEIVAFFMSFIENYNMFSTDDGGQESIEVWVASGREQANILKTLIDGSFSNDRISVNLKLVQGALLQATLAGKAPDVALNLGQSDPVNYALRNAVHPLSDFADFKDVAKQFNDGALVPFTWEDKVYALPETESYCMMFYRKDILSDLSLEPPQTWDDFYELLPLLTRNNMDFGLTSSLNTFATLLYQNGGSFYNADYTQSALGSITALSTFTQWTDLYASYRLPVSFDFSNRFRTGEMPIAVVDYTMYNTLTAFAQEIRGLWDFTEIPGTYDPSTGTIDRSTVNSVTGSVILAASQHKEAGWEFIKWWLGADTQAEYASKLESVLGESARYAAANLEARQNSGWSRRALEKLNAQAEWVEGIPEIAGGYFTSRHITNAFNAVINKGDAPTETLISYVRLIDREIEAKRKELQMD